MSNKIYLFHTTLHNTLHHITINYIKCFYEKKNAKCNDKHGNKTHVGKQSSVT